MIEKLGLGHESVQWQAAADERWQVHGTGPVQRREWEPSPLASIMECPCTWSADLSASPSAGWQVNKRKGNRPRQRMRQFEVLIICHSVLQFTGHMRAIRLMCVAANALGSIWP